MIKAYSIQIKGYARKRVYLPWDNHLTKRTSIKAFPTRKDARRYGRYVLGNCLPALGLFLPVSFKVYSYEVDDEYFKDDLNFK